MPPIPTITQRFPPLPLEEVIEAIRQFDSADHETKRTIIRRFVTAHPCLSYDWGKNWRYRRVRKIEPGHNAPTNVDGLIWRSERPAKLGRANPAGFKVLYLADRRDTALSETRIEHDQVVISEFQIQQGKSVRMAPIGELTSIQRTGRGFLDSEASNEISSLMNACDARECRAMLITDAFLHKCLTNQEDNYVISSEVALAVFEKLPLIDSVAYPSRRQLGAINFAVRSDRVWNSWGVSSVRQAQAKHLAMGYYDLSEVRHVKGITIAGDLVWEDEFDEEQNSCLQLNPIWWSQTALL